MYAFAQWSLPRLHRAHQCSGKDFGDAPVIPEGALTLVEMSLVKDVIAQYGQFRESLLVLFSLVLSIAFLLDLLVAQLACACTTAHVDVVDLTSHISTCHCRRHRV